MPKKSLRLKLNLKDTPILHGLVSKIELRRDWNLPRCQRDVLVLRKRLNIAPHIATRLRVMPRRKLDGNLSAPRISIIIQREDLNNRLDCLRRNRHAPNATRLDVRIVRILPTRQSALHAKRNVSSLRRTSERTNNQEARRMPPEEVATRVSDLNEFGIATLPTGGL